MLTSEVYHVLDPFTDMQASIQFLRGDIAISGTNKANMAVESWNL